MKYIRENIEEQDIVYMRRVGEYGPENYALMEKMKVWITSKAMWAEDTTIYVIAHDDAEKTPSEECKCDVALVVSRKIKDELVENGKLQHGEYLVFEIENDVDSICRFWHEYAQTLKSLKLELDDKRRVMQRYTMINMVNNKCEYCVPVRTTSKT